MAARECQVWLLRATPAKPPASVWWRCPDGAENGLAVADPVCARLTAALSPVEPSGVAARILTRLREENLLPPHCAGTP